MITNSGFKIAINRIAKSIPDYTPVSQFKVGITQATPTITDTDLTSPVIISGASYLKDITDSECTIDENTYESTSTSYINSVEANGNDLNGIGIFNTDGTPKMEDITDFTTITKGSSVEVVIEIINRVRRR